MKMNRTTHDCAICHRKMKRNTLTTKCKHNFHSNCLSEWLERGTNTCPLCRSTGISNALLRNIDLVKDNYLATIKAFDDQFDKIDYKFIRMNFPMNLFHNGMRQRIANNKYTIAMLWALFFDPQKQLKKLKKAFIILIKARVKLENKLKNPKLGNLNINSTNNLRLHEQNVTFFKDIYPFHMFSYESIQYNGEPQIADYAFMRDIVKALELYKHNDVTFDDYIKFLTSERKTRRQIKLNKRY